MASDIKPQALLLSEAYVDTFTFSPFLSGVKPPTAIGCLPLPSSPPPVSSNRSISPATVKPRFQSKADVGAGTSGLIPRCTECGKRFNSPKALYGHMRCHPDRPYRGMNPRLHFSRPLLLPGPKMVPPKFTDEEYEVAMSLLLLAKATGRGKEICSESVGRKRAWKKAFGKRSRFCVELGNEQGESCCTSTSKSCVWDLNLPPPPDEWSPSNYAYNPPDLKLGI